MTLLPARTGPFVPIVWATAVNYVRRSYRYRISIVQETAYPLLLAATLSFAYRASGTTAIGGVDATGFLAVGAVGVVIWNATVWSAGFSIEHERAEGTLPALLGTAAGRSGIVLGYAVGSVARLAPSLAVLAGAAALSGTHLDVDGPSAPLLSIAVLAAVCACTGYALSALFLVTRNAHNIATLLNFPIWVLAGAVVPRSALPVPLESVSDLVPMSHALDALRSALLSAETVTDLAPRLLTAGWLALLCLVAGRIGLRRAERRARRTGTLDLY